MSQALAPQQRSLRSQRNNTLLGTIAHIAVSIYRRIGIDIPRVEGSSILTATPESKDPKQDGSSAKELILLTVSYPPRGGSGVQRVYYQSEHLAEAGMPVHVVTEYGTPIWVRDDTLVRERVKDDQIHRIPKYLPSGTSLIHRLFRRGIRSVLYPDDYLFWAIAAYSRCVNVIQHNNIGCIMASLGHPSVLITLLLLKRRFPRLSIVIDVRDLWVGNEIKLATRTPLWGLGWLNRWLEQAAFRRTDAIVTVSKGLAESIEERYRPVRIKSVHVIENGYVDDVFSTPENIDRSTNRIIFRHIGFLVKDQKVDRFMKALCIVKARDPQSLDDCSIEFVGGNPALPREFATAYGVDDLVTCSGYISHQESVSLMVSADVLLLFWAPGVGTVGGKLYEYLRANQFILAFDQGNRDGKEILNCTERGRAVPIDDIDMQVEMITRLIHTRRNGESLLPSTLPPIDKYSRRKQNVRLMEVLNAVINKTA